MNTIVPAFKPITDAFNYYLYDTYLKDLEQFVGGGPGHDWLSKATRAEQYRYYGQYKKYQKRFQEDPEVGEVISDNIFRLTALAGLDRLITIRQAYGSLKSRFTFADTNGATLNRMTQLQFIRGYFRGALLNLFQFASTFAHPLFYSRGTNYLTHFFYASAFEIITYPVDTIKTLLQADVNGTYKNVFDCIQKTYERNGYKNFYNGILFKLLFNGALIFNLRSIYENDTILQLASFPLLALSYAALTLKTRLQLVDSHLSFQTSSQPGKLVANTFLQRGTSGLFRGLVPFLFLNTFFHYNLYALYSENRQKEVLDHFFEQSASELTSPDKERLWN